MTVCDDTREMRVTRHIVVARSLVGERSILEQWGEAGRTAASDRLRRCLFPTQQQHDCDDETGGQSKHGGEVRIDQSRTTRRFCRKRAGQDGG